MNTLVETVAHEPLSLSNGRHEFPFDYILPENIPSSYIGKYGNVTYTIKVTVTGVKSVDTSISSEPFLVLRRSPLPTAVIKPVSMQKELRIWAACTFGKLYVDISLDKQGGVPGEDIFLKAEIKNHSRRTVTAMQASLMMNSSFRAQNNNTEFRQVVSKKRDEFDISYMEGRRWTFVRLTLPPYIPESKLEFCDIIEVEYLFQFRVELSGGSEIKMEMPFWIGAQPLGLEIPADKKTGAQINRQWTVRGTKGMLEEADIPRMDYDEGWGVEIVPELRSESSVTSNPLFHHFAQKEVKVLPDETIENTKL